MAFPNCYNDRSFQNGRSGGGPDFRNCRRGDGDPSRDPGFQNSQRDTRDSRFDDSPNRDLRFQNSQRDNRNSRFDDSPDRDPRFQNSRQGGDDRFREFSGNNGGPGFDNRQGGCNNPRCPNFRGGNRSENSQYNDTGNARFDPLSPSAERNNYTDNDRENRRQSERNAKRCNSSLARELYSCAPPTPGARVNACCCDPQGICREFDVADRCRFWPAFAHPRWLTCDELYSCPTQNP